MRQWYQNQLPGDHPTHVIVNLNIVERVMKLADSTDYMFWTFGGAVPGQFIRVREGDEVQINLDQFSHTINYRTVSIFMP